LILLHGARVGPGGTRPGTHNIIEQLRSPGHLRLSSTSSRPRVDTSENRCSRKEDTL
jgi:hypothetical protein